jgi:hypothetical protein
MSKINETLKQKIDELDLDARLNDAVDQAERVVQRGLETAADLAREHRDEVDRALDRISASIDGRTEGKYADQVGRVRGKVELGLQKLAERRPGPQD